MFSHLLRDGSGGWLGGLDRLPNLNGNSARESVLYFISIAQGVTVWRSFFPSLESNRRGTADVAQ